MLFRVKKLNKKHALVKELKRPKNSMLFVNKKENKK